MIQSPYCHAMQDERMMPRLHRSVAGICLLLALLPLAQLHAQNAPPAPLQIDDDGSVHVPDHVVPPSALMSPEARAYLRDHLKPDPALLRGGGPDNGVPPLIAGYLKRQREMFPVESREIALGGVHAYEYIPRDGISPRNRRRVLVNLHGGGFMGCWPGCAELESIPVAAIGGIRVITLDYRQGPRNRHPAASEDVAAAYRELLKTYRPQDIGIYGCSAGGMLTGMSLAWFQKEKLPRPGAAGVLCAGLTLEGNGFGGDSAFMALPMGEGRAPPRTAAAGALGSAMMPYFAGASAQDPLVAPASSTQVLAKFPPTLIISSTRGFDLSAASHAHRLLVNAGVEAELHVWEGLFHGFFYNTDVPESREVFDVIVRFFDQHLGKRKGD
jgi:acetyl esterase/lipase